MIQSHKVFKKSFAEKWFDRKTMLILSPAVVSAEVMDIFKVAALDRPNVGILSDESLEDVGTLKEKDPALAVLQGLLKGQIKIR